MGHRSSKIDKSIRPSKPKKDRILEVYLKCEHRGGVNNIWISRLTLVQECFSLDEIEKYKNHIDWKYVSEYQRLNLAFITKFMNRIDFSYLSRNKYLTDDIIYEFRNELDIYTIAENNNLSQDLLVKLISSIDRYKFNILIRFGQLPEAVLRKLDLTYHSCAISQYQSLSEKFIIDHKDKLNLKHINRYQKLSLDFIEMNPDLIIWNELSYNKHLTKEIVLKHRLKLKSSEEVENVLLSL